MNYYFNFSTGLIDTLLLKTKAEHYFNQQNLNQKNLSKYRGRNNIEKIDGHYVGTTNGHKTSMGLDEFVYSHLAAQSLKPSINTESNYETEFVSPFPDEINKMLLLLKWVAGIQSITGEWAVEITKDTLKEIEMDHISPMDVKILFEKLFKYTPILIKSIYEKGTYTIKLGPRDLLCELGPGRVNIRLDYPHLLDKIQQHHNKLKEEQKVLNDE